MAPRSIAKSAHHDNTNTQLSIYLHTDYFPSGPKGSKAPWLCSIIEGISRVTCKKPRMDPPRSASLSECGIGPLAYGDMAARTDDISHRRSDCQCLEIVFPCSHLAELSPSKDSKLCCRLISPIFPQIVGSSPNISSPGAPFQSCLSIAQPLNLHTRAHTIPEYIKHIQNDGSIRIFVPIAIGGI